MLSDHMNDQESYWSGDSGDEYIARNSDDRLITNNVVFFSGILSDVPDIGSVLEFGANIGLNLKALRQINPELDLAGIEINARAAQQLSADGFRTYEQSIHEFVVDGQWDLTLTKGVLIHINPDQLDDVYRALYDSSRKYILIAEYYSPDPVEIPYRGSRQVLFKRDFASELLEIYRDLSVVNYGFTWQHDAHPQDDLTWFLLEKR